MSEQVEMKVGSGNGVKRGAFVHNGKISKVERYKWSSVTRPGTLMLINKDELSVDHDYQRDLREQKASDIAANFSWPAFGVLVVALRPDGVLAVVEGQHRLAAAMKRVDVKEVPCIVFESDGLVSEATTFLKANTLRRPVTAVEKFKALLVTNDPAATVANELIEGCGRKVGTSSPRTVACVGLIVKWAATHPDVLRRIWPLIASMSEGGAIHERIVDAFMYIEIRMPEGTSLTDARWTKRLRAAGIEELLRRMSAMAAAHARGGASVWAEGIVNRLNKGVHDGNELVLCSLAARRKKDRGDE